MVFKIKKIDKTKKIQKAKIVKPAKERKGVVKFIFNIGKFFKKIGSYFKGSWQELKQVRWPDRKSTWSLTGAVILFSAFFLVLIILLDLGFKTLFNLIIK